MIANNYFNRQFTTSKLGKHSSSRRTRQVSKDVKRMSLEEAESLTSDQVTSAIKSCRRSRACGTDSQHIPLEEPSLFNYYIADIPRPTPPIKRVCYADNITVWASGPKIPQLESMINSYLRDVGIYLKENSLLISAPKSTVTLFTRTNTSSRRIPILLLKTHTYH